MSKEIKKAGFIGMGDIGLPMAKNVVTKGFPTTICGHRRRQPIEEMVALGAVEVSTPREVMQASDGTIIVVRTDQQVEDVVFGPNGLMEGIKEGDGILLMGTYRPALCQRIAREARAKGADVFDAPVVGARMGAAAGTLGISAGGDKENLERFRALLETMGKITYCGDVGMGQIVKLANNMAAIIQGLVAYEAIGWGIACGASEEMLVEHLRNGSGSSFAIQNWEWLKSFMTDPPSTTYYIGAKDLGHALEVAHEIGQPCPISGLVRELHIMRVPRLPEGPKTGM